MILDPLSLAGQRGFPLIELLREQLHYSFTVMLLPRPEITEFPLQQFYRYVLSPGRILSEQLSSSSEASHSLETGGISIAATALFENLPRQHVLTTRVDIPELWNVQTAQAIQDIDNLQCTTQACGDPVNLVLAKHRKDFTSIGYLLKNLLVSGQCFQTTAGKNDSLIKEATHKSTHFDSFLV